uniref:Uncharacterized protein n=1 Tax=Megaselia scalaris TaxID=36166 RepID=T1GX59_MEGSC
MLIPFQSKSPTCHLFYSTMTNILYKLMDNFLKKSCVSKKNGNDIERKDLKELASVNVENSKNHLELDKVYFGTSVKKIFAEIKNSKVTESLKKEFLQMYIVLTTTIQKKIPITNDILKNLQFLHPSLKTNPNSSNAIKQLASVMGNCLKNTHITKGFTLDEYVEKVYTEFQFFQIDTEITHDIETGIDVFWDKVGNITDLNGNLKYKNLSNFTKIKKKLAVLKKKSTELDISTFLQLMIAYFL